MGSLWPLQTFLKIFLVYFSCTDVNSCWNGRKDEWNIYLTIPKVVCTSARLEEYSWRWDWWPRHVALVVGSYKIDFENIDGNNFGIQSAKLWIPWFKLILRLLWKIKDISVMKTFRDHIKKKTFDHIKSCLFKEVKYWFKDDECVIILWRTLEKNCIAFIQWTKCMASEWSQTCQCTHKY